MADPTTPNVGLTQPTVGADSGTWGGILNTDLTQIDSKFGGVTSLALTNANVTLTPAQYGNAIIELSGALTANVTVFFPNGVGGVWQVTNNCTGGFIVTLSVLGGFLPNSYILTPSTGGGTFGTTVFSDGTSILTSNFGAIPTGAVLPYGGATAPPGFLLCRGQNVGRVPFAALFSVIGGTFGVGDGSTTFTLPNTIGRAPVGLDTTGTVLPGGFYPNSNLIGALGGLAAYSLGSVGGAAENAFHVHPSSLSDPGHAHTFPFGNELPVAQAGSGALSNTAFSNLSTTAAATGIVLNNAGSGSSQAHLNIQPSITFNMIIKT